MEILWIETTNGKMMPCEVKQTTVVTPKGQVVYGHIPLGQLPQGCRLQMTEKESEKMRRLEFAQVYLSSQTRAIQSILRGEPTIWEPPRLEEGELTPEKSLKM